MYLSPAAWRFEITELLENLVEAILLQNKWMTEGGDTWQVKVRILPDVNREDHLQGSSQHNMCGFMKIER